MKKTIFLVILLGSLNLYGQSLLDLTNKNGDKVIKLTVNNFIKMVDLSYSDWEKLVKKLGYTHSQTDGQFEDFEKGSYTKKNNHWIGKGRIKPQVNYISFGNDDKSDVNALIDELRDYYFKDMDTGEMIFVISRGNYYYQFGIKRKDTFSDSIFVSRFAK